MNIKKAAGWAAFSGFATVNNYDGYEFTSKRTTVQRATLSVLVCLCEEVIASILLVSALEACNDGTTLMRVLAHI